MKKEHENKSNYNELSYKKNIEKVTSDYDKRYNDILKENA